MGTELHFIAIPVESFLKTKETPALESLGALTNLVGVEDASPEVLRDMVASSLETATDADEEFRNIQFLVDAGAVPKEELDMRYGDFGPLMKLFEAAPTAFGKCFSGGEAIGGFDAIWGDDVQRLSESLAELQSGEEQLDMPVNWLQSLYGEAARRNWALLRYTA